MAYVFSHLILLSPSHKVSVINVFCDFNTISQLPDLFIVVFWGPWTRSGSESWPDLHEELGHSRWMEQLPLVLSSSRSHSLALEGAMAERVRKSLHEF